MNKIGVSFVVGAFELVSLGKVQAGLIFDRTPRYGFNLDGNAVTLSKSAGGGNSEYEVVPDSRSNSYYVKKHIGNVKYNDFKVQMGLNMGPAVKEWIDNSLKMNYMRKDGELKSADFKRKLKETREFKNALISEIGFPEVDGASKEASYLNVEFTPETVKFVKGSGEKIRKKEYPKAKPIRPDHSSMTLDGIDSSGIVRVDPFIIQIPKPAPSGQPTQRINFPNLIITTEGATTDAFKTWMAEFTQNKENPDVKYKQGKIVFATKRQKKLLELTLKGVGIFGISEEPAQNRGDKINRAIIDLYVEEMSVDLSRAVASKGSVGDTKSAGANRQIASDQDDPAGFDPDDDDDLLE